MHDILMLGNTTFRQALQYVREAYPHLIYHQLNFANLPRLDTEDKNAKTLQAELYLFHWQNPSISSSKDCPRSNN